MRGDGLDESAAGGLGVGGIGDCVPDFGLSSVEVDLDEEVGEETDGAVGGGWG